MWIIGTDKRGQRETPTRGLWTRWFQGIPLLSKILWGLLVAAVGMGCSPSVKVEAPDKPIEINVNVKIEQEVRIKLDKEVENALEENPELFGGR